MVPEGYDLTGIGTIIGAHPEWTNLQVKQKIISTATPLSNHWLYGAGLVNATTAADIPASVLSGSTSYPDDGTVRFRTFF